MDALLLSVPLLGALVASAPETAAGHRVLVMEPVVEGDVPPAFTDVLAASIAQALGSRSLVRVDDPQADPCVEEACIRERAQALSVEDVLLVRAVRLGDAIVVTLERRKSDGSLFATSVRSVATNRPERITGELAPAMEELFPTPPPPPPDPRIAEESFKRTALSLLGGSGMALAFVVFAVSLGGGAISGGVMLSNLINAWVTMNAPAYPTYPGQPLYDDRYRAAGYNLAAAASSGVILAGFFVLAVVAVSAELVSSALFAMAMRL